MVINFLTRNLKVNIYTNRQSEKLMELKHLTLLAACGLYVDYAYNIHITNFKIHTNFCFRILQILLIISLANEAKVPVNIIKRILQFLQGEPINTIRHCCR